MISKSLLFTYKSFVFARKLFVMNTKLTLSLEKEIIEKAKKYAREKNLSFPWLMIRYPYLLSTLTGLF